MKPIHFALNTIPERVTLLEMRFYFNLVTATQRIADEEGVEAKDLEQAWAQAIKAIEELREEDAGEAEDWADWSLEVTDSAGTIFFSINLGRSLH